MRHILAASVVLLLVPAYILAVSMLPATIHSTCGDGDSQVRGGQERVGFCSQIGFSVQRSYYFGLLTLPVYKAGFDVDLANRLFLPVLLLAAAAILAHKRYRASPSSDQPVQHQYSYERETVSPD